MGLFLKDIHNQGDCPMSSAVLQMRTSALCGERTSDFSKLMVCSHGQGGGSHFFSVFVRTYFMKGP